MCVCKCVCVYVCKSKRYNVVVYVCVVHDSEEMTTSLDVVVWEMSTQASYGIVCSWTISPLSPVLVSMTATCAT